MNADSSHTETAIDRYGRWFLLAIAGAMVAAGALLPELGDVSRVALIVLGSLLLLAAVALPRVREVSAGSKSFSLKLDGLAEAVKDEVAAKGLSPAQSVDATILVIERLMADRDALIRDAERGRALAAAILAEADQFEEDESKQSP